VGSYVGPRTGLDVVANIKIVMYAGDRTADIQPSAVSFTELSQLLLIPNKQLISYPGAERR
jgi:hypothetical protein